MAIREIDRRVYEDELATWLPEDVIDIHVHIGLAKHAGPVSPERIGANWALEVGVEQSWEQLGENLKMLLPRQRVGVLAFGGVYREVDIEANNAYLLEGPTQRSSPADGPAKESLMVTKPEWDAEAVERGFESGFVGIKPYPDLAPDMDGESGIFDCCPREHLEVVNRHGGVMMLHLPRKGRLADPDNLREIIEIAEEYPSIRLIVAHIGRSFCLPTAQKGLPHLVDYPSLYFDTSANLNADVFTYALDTIGPDRLLYGSDLPITLLRGVRKHVGENYINYTDALYSWNTNRKSAKEEASYTFYLYEELRALIAAVQRAGLDKDSMRKIMYMNSARLLGLEAS